VGKEVGRRYGERNTRKKHEKRDAVRGQRKSNGGDKRASHRGEQAKGYRDSKIGALQAIAIFGIAAIETRNNKAVVHANPEGDC
jgi:hypothetical protein